MIQVIADAWNLRSKHVQGDIAALAASIAPARSSVARAFTEQARDFLAARAYLRPQAQVSR